MSLCDSVGKTEEKHLCQSSDQELIESPSLDGILQVIEPDRFNVGLLIC